MTDIGIDIGLYQAPPHSTNYASKLTTVRLFGYFHQEPTEFSMLNEHVGIIDTTIGTKGG